MGHLFTNVKDGVGTGVRADLRGGLCSSSHFAVSHCKDLDKSLSVDASFYG